MFVVKYIPLYSKSSNKDVKGSDYQSELLTRKNCHEKRCFGTHVDIILSSL